METLKDCAHLYVGCEIETVDGDGINLGHFYPEVWLHIMDKVEPNGINVFFPNLNKIYVMNYIQCKLKLRPLDSMFEEERDEYENISDEQDNYRSSKWALFIHNGGSVKYLLSKYFDLFGLIENGFALDATKIKQPQ